MQVRHIAKPYWFQLHTLKHVITKGCTPSLQKYQSNIPLLMRLFFFFFLHISEPE